VATARGQEDSADVKEATQTVLHPSPLGRALPRGPSLGLRRTLRPGVVNLAGQPADAPARAVKKEEPNGQVGQAFLDLLLVGATAVFLGCRWAQASGTTAAWVGYLGAAGEAVTVVVEVGCATTVAVTDPAVPFPPSA
jgi:hypothetical protein